MHLVCLAILPSVKCNDYGVSSRISFCLFSQFLWFRIESLFGAFWQLFNFWKIVKKVIQKMYWKLIFKKKIKKTLIRNSITGHSCTLRSVAHSKVWAAFRKKVVPVRSYFCTGSPVQCSSCRLENSWPVKQLRKKTTTFFLYFHKELMIWVILNVKMKQ